MNHKVISGLFHKPIKMWTNGLSVEDDALTQLKNTASMSFVRPHVSVMPDVHLGKGSTIGSVIPTQGAIIPATVGVDIGCFVGETKIPLLNGTQKTLKELAEYTEPFWVYSCSNFKVVAGKATCKKTRKDADLVKVTISGGDEIICTPDHKFMLFDGSYKEAKDLSYNESLMPLYRKWHKKDGYESSNCGYNTSNLTHWASWESIHGEIPKGYVIHHRDHFYLNNDPDNLEAMTARDHSKHHRLDNQTFDNSSEEFQKLRMAGIKRRVSDPVSFEKMVKVGTENIKKYMEESREDFLDKVKDNGKRGAPYLHKFNTSPRSCDECDHTSKNPAALNWHKRKEHGSNHRVISVENLGFKDDVYCLTVEDHHNFALCAGVFVHNCGMMAIKTSLMASDLPDNLFGIRSAIESAVPHGRNGGQGRDKGAWGNIPHGIRNIWNAQLLTDFYKIVDKYPSLRKTNNDNHLGTLGTGNHFIELCIDEDSHVWVMLHSGSRGVGNAIGTLFIELAKKDMQRYFINLPDVDLAYLPEGSVYFDDYIFALNWAQKFAALNREIMMDNVLSALHSIITKKFCCLEEAINCHHNYVQKEHHFGKNLWITRKGAVSAKESQLGIIPGSMGAKSFIVRGLGNADSFHSCSHGAGRVMSRTQAKKIITLDDHIKATSHVECRKDEDVIDESPSCYKDIDSVMAAQPDLVEIVHTLRQVVCVKG